MYWSTFIPFFTSTAIPPRLPLSRRYSKVWYPGISSFIVDVVNQVSYIHNTSSVCYSTSINNLKWLTPAILMLPTFTPYCFHRYTLVSCYLRCRTDPFVRFYLFFNFAVFPKFRSFSLVVAHLPSLSSVFYSPEALPRSTCALIGTLSYIFRC